MSTALPFRPAAVAFDLDGTLLDHEARLHASIIPAVRRIGNAGIKVFIVTGRLVSGAERHWRALGLDTPLACCNGGIVGFPGAEPLRHARLGDDVRRKIVDIDSATNLYINYSVDGELFALKDGAIREDYIRKFSPVALAPNPEAVLSLPAPTKCLCITGSAEEQPGVIAMLKEKLGDGAVITTSNSRFIEIMPPGVDKGTGITLLADWLGTTTDRFVACGDAMNDLPMLKKAGFAVSFVHGDPRMEEFVDVRLPALWEGGIDMLVENVLGIRG